MDEILNLIESVSEGFPSYSWTSFHFNIPYFLSNRIPQALIAKRHKTILMLDNTTYPIREKSVVLNIVSVEVVFNRLIFAKNK